MYNKFPKEKNMDKKNAARINLWGILLILTSFYGMIVLLTSGYDHYRYLHQEYSASTIVLRYCVSWAVKIFGFISGIGILAGKDFFRKTAIAGSLFAILTTHLKHSAQGFAQHTRYLDEHFDIPLEGFHFSSLTWGAMMISRMIDVIFAAALIYFFTQREVKKHFGR